MLYTKVAIQYHILNKLKTGLSINEPIIIDLFGFKYRLSSRGDNNNMLLFILGTVLNLLKREPDNSFFFKYTGSFILIFNKYIICHRYFNL
jgi:hypothetical protein